MEFGPDYQPDYDALKALLLEMAQEHAVAPLLDMTVRKLAGRAHVALARIWLIQDGDCRFVLIDVIYFFGGQRFGVAYGFINGSVSSRTIEYCYSLETTGEPFIKVRKSCLVRHVRRHREIRFDKLQFGFKKHQTFIDGHSVCFNRSLDLTVALFM